MPFLTYCTLLTTYRFGDKSSLSQTLKITRFFPDINECADLGIKLSCKYGCIDFIGSYICAQHPEETLSDEPIEDNSTLPKEYDEYEDENYDDGDYDENGDYEEDYDENDKISSTTKKPVENIERPKMKKLKLIKTRKRKQQY